MKGACQLILQIAILSLVYRSVKSLKSSSRIVVHHSKKHDIEILQLWTILAVHKLYTISPFEYVISYIPFYYAFKMMVIIATFLPGTKFPHFFFETLVVPVIDKVHTILDVDWKGWIWKHMLLVPWNILDLVFLVGILSDESVITKQVKARRRAELVLIRRNTPILIVEDKDGDNDILGTNLLLSHLLVESVASLLALLRKGTKKSLAVLAETLRHKLPSEDVDSGSLTSCSDLMPRTWSSSAEDMPVTATATSERKTDGGATTEQEGAVKKSVLVSSNLDDDGQLSNCWKRSAAETLVEEITASTHNVFDENHKNQIDDLQSTETLVSGSKTKLPYCAGDKARRKSRTVQLAGSSRTLRSSKTKANMHSPRSTVSRREIQNTLLLSPQLPNDKLLQSSSSPVVRSRITASSLQLRQFSREHNSSIRHLSNERREPMTASFNDSTVADSPRAIRQQDRENCDNSETNTSSLENRRVRSRKKDQNNMDHSENFKTRPPPAAFAYTKTSTHPATDDGALARSKGKVAHNVELDHKNDIQRIPEGLISPASKKNGAAFMTFTTERQKQLSIGDRFRGLVTGDSNIRLRDYLFDLDLPVISSPCFSKEPGYLPGLNNGGSFADEVVVGDESCTASTVFSPAKTKMSNCRNIDREEELKKWREARLAASKTEDRKLPTHTVLHRHQTTLQAGKESNEGDLLLKKKRTDQNFTAKRTADGFSRYASSKPRRHSIHKVIRGTVTEVEDNEKEGPDRNREEALVRRKQRHAVSSNREKEETNTALCSKESQIVRSINPVIVATNERGPASNAKRRSRRISLKKQSFETQFNID